MILEYLIRLGKDLATPYGLLALGVLVLIIAIQWKLNKDKRRKHEKEKTTQV
jgi:hypothetical protein